jgi:hypothetical protein
VADLKGLTPHQSRALALLTEHPEATIRTVVTWATYYEDSEDEPMVFLNARTARSLERRGVVTVQDDGDVVLTEDGLRAVGR